MSSDLKEINSYLRMRDTLYKQICATIERGRLGIWGYGFLGRWLTEQVLSIAQTPPLIFDRNYQTVNQYSVYSIRDPKEIEKSCEALLISARHNVKDISELMGKTNIPFMSVDEFYLHKNFQDYQYVFERLEDEKSRTTLIAIFKSIFSASIVCDELVYGMYFEPTEFFPSFDDHFIDAGAYTGDTLEEFVRLNLGTFKKVTCFEPGLVQYQKLKQRRRQILEKWIIDDDKIKLERKGVGEKSYIASFNVMPKDTMAHHILEPNEKGLCKNVEVVALDHYLNGASASFLKSDVEGNDVSFIKGAKSTIQNFKPKLAISCYHYPTDLVELVQLIDGLGCSYKFKLRHHAKVLGDFVLYGYT